VTGVLFFAIVPFLLTAFGTFDLVLRFQFKNLPDEWARDGKAIGYYWFFPSGSTLFRGSFARDIRMLSWTFGTPTWAAAIPRIRRLLLIMRICVFISYALMIVFFILVGGQ
jgi:hypothetical protein